MVQEWSERTVDARVVWLNVSFFDFPILDEQSVPLRAGLPKDRSGVEGEVEFAREVALGVAEEADLRMCQCLM